jgi:hypothetical protein
MVLVSGTMPTTVAADLSVRMTLADPGAVVTFSEDPVGWAGKRDEIESREASTDA